MSIAARLRTYFFAGILVTAPIGITLWLAWKAVGFFDDRMRGLVPAKWNPEHYLPVELPGLGIIVVLAGLILAGRFTKGFLGRLIIKYSEVLLGKIPVVRSVYSWMQQIFETMLSKDSRAFREVVLIEYPCRGSWAVGFITGQTEGEVQELTSETVSNVFVPATPNPTTGFLLFIPERDIRRLEMSIDDGVKLVISGGIVKPEAAEEPSVWGTGTGIAEAVERIKAEMEQQHLHPPSVWGTATGVAAEVERIKTEMAARNPSTGATGVLGQLRDDLFTGTLVTAPIAITIWLAVGIIDYFDDTVMPLIPFAWDPVADLPVGIPGLGLITAVLSVMLVGFLTAGFLGNAIVRASERLIEGLPVVRGVYAAVKQIFESLLKEQSNAFREVVLVQYPRPEAWAIGFTTGEAAREIQGNTPHDSVNVFLPTTPNPTSGFLLFLPSAEVRRLGMTVEEGLKMVVSGGIVTPSAPAAAQAADAPAAAPESERAGR